jgi:polyisoprenoid-binding protein YceI
MTTRSTASALTIDTARSRIAFEARHLVVHPVRGTFGRWSASLQLDERDFSRSLVRASIEIASIDTGSAERDEHLQALFDASRFPSATFESTRVVQKPEGLDVLGDFTLHGVTREITIDVTLSQRADRFSFVGKTAIGRKHYGIVWSPAIELSSGVSDRVSIELRLDAIRSADLAQRSDLVP